MPLLCSLRDSIDIPYKIKLLAWNVGRDSALNSEGMGLLQERNCRNLPTNLKSAISSQKISSPFHKAAGLTGEATNTLEVLD